MPLAQPDRVFGYEPKGRGFESLKARQKEASIAKRWMLLFVLVFKRRTPQISARKFVITCALCLSHSHCILRTFGFWVPQGKDTHRVSSAFVSSSLYAWTPDGFSLKIHHNVRTVSFTFHCILRTFGFWVPQDGDTLWVSAFCFSFSLCLNPRWIFIENPS